MIALKYYISGSWPCVESTGWALQVRCLEARGKGLKAEVEEEEGCTLCISDDRGDARGAAVT